MFAREPVAIIDIGSNSVRLVVYSGATRIPSVVFNEKVMAGLGRGVADTGELSQEAQERALLALRRFHLLLDQMGVVRTRVVATAAAREARNAPAFLESVRQLGFEPLLIPGEEEARLAGQGVISAIPDADGVVGDLGGGSLELIEVGGGSSGRSVSLPLGVLRLDELARDGVAAFTQRVCESVAAAGFEGSAEGKAFYMVGGSWRALARLEMALIDHPLPITHQHVMPIDRPAQLKRAVRSIDRDEAKGIPSLSASRLPTLPNANLLLDALAKVLRPKALVVSSFGIREGLLFDELDPAVRELDPLIEAAREAGAGLGRFEQHGGLLDSWIAPAFEDTPRQRRLRLAACLLADIAWAAHPDFRAERGIDMALHGNWVAIDLPGRVMLAQALFCNFGGGRELPYPRIAALCSDDELDCAARWGFAMRLGQRLSGGAASGLQRSRLERSNGKLRLVLQKEDAPLVGEAVERRLKTLASELGLKPETVIA
jgi:exopolyphosphatase / guanosine-5'-triphosphate,3'-diphosphate pyrophosphatase